MKTDNHDIDIIMINKIEAGVRRVVGNIKSNHYSNRINFGIGVNVLHYIDTGVGRKWDDYITQQPHIHSHHGSLRDNKIRYQHGHAIEKEDIVQRSF